MDACCCLFILFNCVQQVEWVCLSLVGLFAKCRYFCGSCCCQNVWVVADPGVWVAGAAGPIRSTILFYFIKKKTLYFFKNSCIFTYHPTKFSKLPLHVQFRYLPPRKITWVHHQVVIWVHELCVFEFSSESVRCDIVMLYLKMIKFDD